MMSSSGYLTELRIFVIPWPTVLHIYDAGLGRSRVDWREKKFGLTVLEMLPRVVRRNRSETFDDVNLT